MHHTPRIPAPSPRAKVSADIDGNGLMAAMTARVSSVWKPMKSRNERTRRPKPVMTILSVMFSTAKRNALRMAATVQSMSRSFQAVAEQRVAC